MANNITNWVYYHDDHKRAQKVLTKVKKEFKKKKMKLVQVGPKTWKEVEVKDEI